MEDELDAVFAALSDPTRRRVLAMLKRGSLTVSELAEPHDMSLPGFMKHLRVLEEAGLIARLKEGRAVRCELAAAPLQEAAMWLSHYRKFWDERLDALGRYLYHQEELTPWPPTRPTSEPGCASAAATPSPPKKSGARGPNRKR